MAIYLRAYMVVRHNPDTGGEFLDLQSLSCTPAEAMAKALHLNETAQNTEFKNTHPILRTSPVSVRELQG